jgi:PAS domain S-box-containing protein
MLWLYGVADHANAGGSTSLAVPWLAPGIAVVCLMRYGLRAWPAVFAGSMVVWGGVADSNLPITVVEAAGEALSIVLIVWLLRAWRFRPALDRYRDSLLLLAAVAAGRLVSTVVDVFSMVAAAAYVTDPTLLALLRSAGAARTGHALTVNIELLRFASRWWLNTVAGCLLVVPLLALREVRPFAPRGRDALALTALYGAAALWIAVALASSPGPLLPLFLLGALLLAVWAAVQFRVGVAATVTLPLAVCSTLGFAMHLGVFGGLEPRARVEVAWGFIGLLCGTAPFLTALLSQRERARHEIAASAERYQKLFLGNPFPMWIEDSSSGRILLANPAALLIYGYGQAEFLSLRGSDLQGESGAPSIRARDDGLTLTPERHRTAAGVILEVEVTRAKMIIDEAPVRICFVEPVSERNELRLAVLTAGDLERFRLGGVLHDDLMPLLAGVLHCANQLGALQPTGRALRPDLLDTITAKLAAAARICTQLTRGASPLQNVQGDLVAALDRLSESLSGIMPAVQVSVRSNAALALSIERRDHIYRLAEEAVRRAAALAGTTTIKVSFDVGASKVRLQIEDDGDAASDPARLTDLAHRSMAARAVAAHGRLRITEGRAGATIISFECEQEHPSGLDDEPGRPADEPRPLAPDATGGPDSPAPLSAPWLAQVLLLAIAYSTAAILGLWFVREVAALNVSLPGTPAIPWIAGGVAVAGLLMGGARLWPALFVGYVVIWQGVSHQGWLGVLLGAIAQSAAAVLTVQLLHRFGFRRAFDRVRDFLLLLGAAAIGRALFVPADLLSLHLVDPLTAARAMRELSASSSSMFGISAAQLGALTQWFLNGVAGIVLVVPALLAWSSGAWTNIRSRAPEVVLWSAALALSVFAMLGIDAPEGRLPVLALGLTTVTWGAVRIGAGAASAATLLLSLAATVSYGVGRGILAPAGPTEGLAVFWGFIVLLVTTAHVLTALLADNDRAHRELERLDRRYRTLFEAVPHPLFACAIPSGRILFANAAATRRYGHTTAEFAAMSLAGLDADAAHPAHIPNWSTASRITTRHRDKWGAIIEVELALLPVEIDGRRGGLCFAGDVSERNRLRTRLIEATDRERRSLAREFHDGLGQILVGLQLGTVPLARSAQRGEPLDYASVIFVAQAAQEALLTCERVLRGVSPLQQVGGDLLEAIHRLASRLPPSAGDRLSVSITAEDAVRVPLEMREHLYQIAQEAVTNSLKHSLADQISVTVAVTAEAIELCVADNGVGFNPASRTSGLGLDSLALRAAALGARLYIARRGVSGTVVTCLCPQGPPDGYAVARTEAEI